VLIDLLRIDRATLISKMSPCKPSIKSGILWEQMSTGLSMERLCGKHNVAATEGVRKRTALTEGTCRGRAGCEG
jgi:hypothetical protein